METIVKENVTLYPASPAGGGCRALARQVGVCGEGDLALPGLSVHDPELIVLPSKWR